MMTSQEFDELKKRHGIDCAERDEAILEKRWRFTHRDRWLLIKEVERLESELADSRRAVLNGMRELGKSLPDTKGTT